MGACLVRGVRACAALPRPTGRKANPMTEQLTERDVRGIAESVRIGLTDGEVSAMTRDAHSCVLPIY